MQLQKILVLLVVIHVGLGVASLGHVVFSTDNEASWGTFLSVTPLGEFGILAGADAEGNIGKVGIDPETGETIEGFNTSASFLDIAKDVIAIPNSLREAVIGLTVLRYPVITSITADDGFAYMPVLILRVAMSLFQIATILYLFKMLMDTGLLNSLVGLGVVGIGGAAMMAGPVINFVAKYV